MTLGAFLVLSGLLLMYGAITDQNALDAVRSVLSGSTDTKRAKDAKGPVAATAAAPAAPPKAPA